MLKIYIFWVEEEEEGEGEEEETFSLHNASMLSLLLNTFFSSTVALDLISLWNWVKQAFQWWVSKVNKLWGIKSSRVNYLK